MAVRGRPGGIGGAALSPGNGWPPGALRQRGGVLTRHRARQDVASGRQSKDGAAMRWWMALAVVVLFAQGAGAQDRPTLASVEARAIAALGEGYIARAEDDRLILTCPGCAGTPMLEIRLGRQDDGTEARLRSGYTTISSLDQQCRGRNPTCRVERADLGPAVGWVSAYRAGEVAGSTLVLLRDGAMVIVRSIAGSPDLARGNVERLRTEVLPALVGN
jgi:hypothetical protein